MRELPYEHPEAGHDYWIVDDVLPDPDAVRRRCLHSNRWEYGFPHAPEAWPGMRTIPALTDEELAWLDDRVCAFTGASRVWMEQVEGGGRLNHNCAQVVGANEGKVRPHTDSRRLCRYAAVLYLTPDAPPACGTAFFRQRMPDGREGGNRVVAPHHNMVEALGTRFVPPGSFTPDVRIDNRYNRLFLYRANIIHSATAYCGRQLEDRRMTVVFFWMA